MALSKLITHGEEVAFSDSGTGERAVVLLHGWGGTQAVWDRVLPLDEGTYRTIRLDFPGHGASGPMRSPELCTLEFLVESTVGVVRQCGIKSVVMVGHSMGGCAAAECAIACAGLVRGVVLVDSGIQRSSSAKLPASSSCSPVGHAEACDLLDKLSAMELPATVREDLHAAVRAANPVVLGVLLGDLLRYGASAPIPSHVVALMNGENPIWDGYESFLQANTSSLDYREYTGGGHFPMLVIPGRFRQMLDAALACFSWS